MPQKSKAHDRILKLTVEVSGESDDEVTVTKAEYFRDRAHFNDDDGFELTFEAGDAGSAHEILFQEMVPPPTHIAFSVSNP